MAFPNGSPLVNIIRFLFDLIPANNGATVQHLPREIMDDILIRAGILQPTQPSIASHAPYQPPRQHPASLPVRLWHDGKAQIFRLPLELRQQIFAEFLPSKDTVILPSRRRSDKEWEDGLLERISSRHKPFTTLGLLTLNRQLCAEISTIIYEERTFAIHVYDGIKDGGIEFINAGRQKLAYKDSVEDARFYKFIENDVFGFGRMKKIEITIFPSVFEDRHNALWTHYMMLALCKMLDRRDKDRITALTVIFAKEIVVRSAKGVPQKIVKAEDYWYDQEAKAPRTTSFHGITNIELMLKPLARLPEVHNVNIVVPTSIRNNSLMSNIAQLEQSMRSKDMIVTDEDDLLAFKIELARIAMEDYVFRELHGRKADEIEDLTAKEMEEEDQIAVVDPDENTRRGSSRWHLGPITGAKRRRVERADSMTYNPADDYFAQMGAVENMTDEEAIVQQVMRDSMKPVLNTDGMTEHNLSNRSREVFITEPNISSRANFSQWNSGPDKYAGVTLKPRDALDFSDITGATIEQAIQHLQAANGDYEAAVNLWYNTAETGTKMLDSTKRRESQKDEDAGDDDDMPSSF